MTPYSLPEEAIQVPRFHESNGFYTTTALSKQMGKIRSKNTRPEIRLRKALFAHGLRFRLYDKTLPGRPDISICKYKLAIFIDGEFWHGYDWATRREQVKSNRGFWLPKIERNMQRDRQINQKLLEAGYTVIRFWQQDVTKNLGACVQTVISLAAERQEPAQFFQYDFSLDV